MREKDTPEVVKYLEAEGAYAEATAAMLKPFSAELYAQMLARIKQTDLNVPTREGGFHYYHRTIEGQQHPIRCRKPAGFDSRRLSLLDRGIPYAIAHIRGGDELGEPWHDDGMLMKK